MYYHIWFVTKYRKAVLEGEIEEMIRNIFTECMSRHAYNILAFETNKDHVHLLVKIENKKELASMVRTLKAVSAREILRRQARRGRQAFWAKRYGYKEVLPENLSVVKQYIRDQKNIPHASAWGMDSNRGIMDTTRGNVWRRKTEVKL